MDIPCWVYFGNHIPLPMQKTLLDGLQKEGIDTTLFRNDFISRLGVCFIAEITDFIFTFIRTAKAAGADQIIVLLHTEAASNESSAWDLLEFGASDILIWSNSANIFQQIKARFERWLSVESLLDTSVVKDIAVGKSAIWRATLRGIVEIAHFSDATTLLLGESGTGKEVVANLIHRLDARLDKQDMVVLDCSTIVPELAGSEFFGHERGAFTGALADRQGAFALANGGTLFLDEIGELPLPLQAKLLRVIQERTYKRVGGSTWHRTQFRLICATNRNLVEMVQQGTFRADLYYRIAGFISRLPPLRERLDDVIPLAEHFIRTMRPDRTKPMLDPIVRSYLLRREYPGNVRELKQVVSRFVYRCADDATISLGYLSTEERLPGASKQLQWMNAQFESIIQRAVSSGAGLKEIGRAAEDCAIRCVTREEDGSLQRAAQRLGVSDRSLQLRRAHPKGLGDCQANNGRDMRD